MGRGSHTEIQTAPSIEGVASISSETIEKVMGVKTGKGREEKEEQ